MLRIIALVSFFALSHGYVNFTSLPKGLKPPVPLKSIAPVESPRIIGGQATTIENHPYAVSIQHEWEEYIYGWLHFCTGTIISEEWILATGQCAIIFTLERVRVRVGSTFSHEGGSVYDIVEVIVHPLFDEIINDYDISLMRPNTSLVLSNVVQPIRLPRPGTTYPEGTIFTMPSWGAVVYLGQSVTELQEIDLPTITTELCQTVYSDLITDRLFCSYEENVGMCIGDTAAPAVVNGVLIGMASWHYACSAYGYPNVYVDLPVLVEWITESTGVSSATATSPQIGLLVAVVLLFKPRITET